MHGHGTYDSTLLGNKLQFGTNVSSPIYVTNPKVEILYDIYHCKIQEV